MSAPTKRDVIEAALSVADDAAQGRLSPTDLQRQAVAELRDLFGTVVGDGDPLWELQCEIARQAVGLGALSPDELSEWAAVLRHRAGEPPEPTEPPDDPIPMVSSASVDESPDSDRSDDDDTDAAALQGVSVAAALAELSSRAAAQRAARETAKAKAKPQGSADGYDPLAGWNAGGSRQV